MGAYFIRDPNFVNMFTQHSCMCCADKDLSSDEIKGLSDAGLLGTLAPGAPSERHSDNAKGHGKFKQTAGWCLQQYIGGQDKMRGFRRGCDAVISVLGTGGVNHALNRSALFIRTLGVLRGDPPCAAVGRKLKTVALRLGSQQAVARLRGQRSTI